MAKVTRGALKGIVKECLIEILAEGILADGTPNAIHSKPKKKSSPKRKRMPNPNHDNMIQEAVSGLTSDPIMADIFSDTAKNTLQEQLQAESAAPGALAGDHASREAASSEPDDLFGDASQNWAALAFSDAKAK
tara:strand:- start:349 stop:750 length:402 start_codon:yes stop_codon:yes gene_type:complete